MIGRTLMQKNEATNKRGSWPGIYTDLRPGIAMNARFSLNPPPSSTHPLGVTSDKIEGLHFRRRSLMITGGYFGASISQFRRHDGSQNLSWQSGETPFDTGDETDLGRWPGVFISDLAITGGFSDLLGLLIGFPGRWNSGTDDPPGIYPTGSRAVLVPQYFYPTFPGAPGIPGGAEGLQMAACHFHEGLEYPCIVFEFHTNATPALDNTFFSTIDNYEVSGGMTTFAAGTLQVLDWGTIPITGYTTWGGTPPEIGDIEVGTPSHAEAFFAYNHLVLGPRFNTTTGAALRPPALE